jgi:hypothetical protein
VLALPSTPFIGLAAFLSEYNQNFEGEKYGCETLRREYGIQHQ